MTTLSYPYDLVEFSPAQLYHVYNRGNNQQPIFFNRENYLFFLRKIRTHLTPVCSVLAYALMPNHFHFLIATPDSYPQSSDDSKSSDDADSNCEFAINQAIAVILRSYTRAINIQQDRTGSLFQQKTKARLITNDAYAAACFHYIHQNPYRAGLSQRIEDWEFSSFKDYVRLRNGTLCRQDIAAQVLPIQFNRLLNESYEVIPAEHVREFC